MPRPSPTLLYRLTHAENLRLLVQRDGLHAPSAAPDDDLVYRGIHDRSIQTRRGPRPIPCGPGGTIENYVSFYFCRRNVGGSPVEALPVRVRSDWYY